MAQTHIHTQTKRISEAHTGEAASEEGEKTKANAQIDCCFCGGVAQLRVVGVLEPVYRVQDACNRIHTHTTYTTHTCGEKPWEKLTY